MLRSVVTIFILQNKTQINLFYQLPSHQGRLLMGAGGVKGGRADPPPPLSPIRAHTHTPSPSHHRPYTLLPPLVSVATAKPEVTVKLVCR